MFRVIDRYLFKEVFGAWLAVTAVLWLILVSNRLVRYFGEAAAGDLPADVIFTLIALKSVNYLVLLAPAALYLAVVFTVGRLYRDNEMAVLAACGVGPAQLYRPLLLAAVPLALGLAFMSLYVAPKTAALGYEIRDRAEREAETGILYAGRFQESREGERVFYVEEVSRDRRHMHNVFVHARMKDRFGVVASERAYQYTDPETGDRYVVLVDGYRYEGVPGGADFRIIRFEKHAVRVQARDAGAVRSKRDAVPTAELWASGRPGDMAELQWRFSVPVSTLLLAMLALPLGKTPPRQGRYGKLLAAVLVYIVYANLLVMCEVWLEKGILPAALGMWWVHGALIVLTGVLLVRQYGTGTAARFAGAGNA